MLILIPDKKTTLGSSRSTICTMLMLQGDLQPLTQQVDRLSAMTRWLWQNLWRKVNVKLTNKHKWAKNKLSAAAAAWADRKHSLCFLEFLQTRLPAPKNTANCLLLRNSSHFEKQKWKMEKRWDFGVWCRVSDWIQVQYTKIFFYMPILGQNADLLAQKLPISKVTEVAPSVSINWKIRKSAGNWGSNRSCFAKTDQ